MIVGRILCLIVVITVGLTTASCGKLGQATPKKMHVWAIGDCVRVCPQTGRLFEEDSFALPGGISGNYKKVNWVWDGQTKAIQLYAAKNEIVAFQLIIDRGKEKLQNVRVKISDLTGPKGQIIGSRNINLFRQWYVHIPERAKLTGALRPGWYPDPLIPFEAEKHGAPFDIPGPEFKDGAGNCPNQKNQAVWVDIYVPKDTLPGNYQGTIVITATGNKKECLSLNLKVWNFTLPDTQHLTINLMGYYGFPSPEAKYFQMAHRHRVGIAAIYVGPEVSGEGLNRRISSWEKYDKRMGPCLSGKLFTKEEGYLGPGENTPVSHIFLPFETIGSEAWPIAKSYMHTSIYDLVVKRAYLDFERHFKEKGWDKTKLIVWYNDFDEPSDWRKISARESLEEIKYLGRLLKESGVKSKNIKYRFDLGHLKDIYRMPSLSDWSSATVLEELGDVIDIWNIQGGWHMGYALFDSDKLRQRVEKYGEEAWFYNEAIPAAAGISGAGINFRVWSWLVWKYGLTGWCVWHCTLRGKTNPFFETTDGSPALYFYPGSDIGLDYPISSIRLKSMRRGAQDYEYMWLLTQKMKGNRKLAENIVNQVVFRGLDKIKSPNDKAPWLHHPAQWELARNDLAQQIHKIL